MKTIWTKWQRAVGCDKKLWRRSWRVEVNKTWSVQNVGQKPFAELFIREFMPYPGIIFRINIPTKRSPRHSYRQISLCFKAAFRYTAYCRRRAAELKMDPYQLAGAKETP